MAEKLDWTWMEQHMPNVVRQMREIREAGEGSHLNECWRRGVVIGQPDWFYAREGAIALGTAFREHRIPMALRCREELVDHIPLSSAWCERRAEGLWLLLLAPLPNGSQPRRLRREEKYARGIGDGTE